MEKIVYLFGAGAIKAEMTRQGVESDITMRGIGENVLKLSQEKNGHYWNIHENFGLPEDQDIEIMMSLLEGTTALQSSTFEDVINELRRLFRIYLVTQITDKQVTPKIHSSLLYLHKNYGQNMGGKGEELAGVLTINYDSVVDDAFCMVHQAINYGYTFDSDTYQSNETIPPLLKLHGSFNWKIADDRLIVSKNFETKEYEDDYSGWIPPSVYKRPPGVIFQSIWDKAAKLLEACDVLRIIGSSLRNEDLPLLSLVFISQLKSQKIFSIELIVSDKDAIGEESALGKEEHILGIMQRLPFLGRVRNFSALHVFQEESYIPENIFYSWVLMKVREIERNRGGSLNDDFINSMLLSEV